MSKPTTKRNVKSGAQALKPPALRFRRLVMEKQPKRNEESLGDHADMVSVLLHFRDGQFSEEIIRKYLKNLVITDKNNDLIIVHYSQSANLDDPELPLLREIRGVIIAPKIGPLVPVGDTGRQTRGTIVCVSGGRLAEYYAQQIITVDEDLNRVNESDATHYLVNSVDPNTGIVRTELTDFANTEFSLAHDVVVLRIFCFKGIHYVATHRRLDASRSKYNTAGMTFIEALIQVGMPNPADLFPQGCIYSPYVYTFLLSSREVIKCSRVKTHPSGFIIFNEIYAAWKLPSSEIEEADFPFSFTAEDSSEFRPYLGTVHYQPASLEITQGPITNYHEKSHIIERQLITLEQANLYLIHGYYPVGTKFSEMFYDPRLHAQEGIYVTMKNNDGQIVKAFKVVPPGLQFSCRILGPRHNFYRSYVIYFSQFKYFCEAIYKLMKYKEDLIEKSHNVTRLITKMGKKKDEAKLNELKAEKTKLEDELERVNEELAKWKTEFLNYTPFFNPNHQFVSFLEVSLIQKQARIGTILRAIDLDSLSMTDFELKHIEPYVSNIKNIEKVTYLVFTFCCNIIHGEMLAEIPNRFAQDIDRSVRYLESQIQGNAFSEIPPEVELTQKQRNLIEFIREILGRIRDRDNARRNKKAPTRSSERSYTELKELAKESERSYNDLKSRILSFDSDTLYKIFKLVSLATGVNTAYTTSSVSMFRGNSFPTLSGQGNVQVLPRESLNPPENPAEPAETVATINNNPWQTTRGPQSDKWKKVVLQTPFPTFRGRVQTPFSPGSRTSQLAGNLPI